MSQRADSRPGLAVVVVPGILLALSLLISPVGTTAGGDAGCGPTIQLGLRNCTISDPVLKDVFSWGASLGIGTDGAQVWYVMIPSRCDPPNSN